MRHRLACSALSTALLWGCNSATLQPIAKVGSDILGAGQGIRSAGVSAESAAVHLRRGLEGLDPAGIKELLAANTKLREELERVQKIYLQGLGGGVVDITGREVQMRVSRTAGDLIINAWIDTPQNQFWSGRIMNREARLPVSVERFMREFPYRRCERLVNLVSSTCFTGAQRAAAGAADVLIQEEFQRYLRSAAAVPVPDLPPSIANPRFGGSGQHQVFFEVVPVKPDANGNWAARLEIWLVGQGTQSNVFVYDVDNGRYPQHTIGEPLTPIVATLLVRAAAP
jgi:hypothetical protein